MNDVYPFVVIFVGVVIGLIDAFHFLRREEGVLRFPIIVRGRHLRIALRWKAALVGAVKHAAALTVICVMCVGGLAAAVTLTDYGGEDLPRLALDLVNLSPFAFRKPADVRSQFAARQATLLVHEWDDDFALLRSVVVPLVALALPIGVTTFFALRMGAAFVEVFLTNPLPQLGGAALVAPVEELSALVDALQLAAPLSAEAHLKAFDAAASEAPAAASAGGAGALGASAAAGGGDGFGDASGYAARRRTQRSQLRRGIGERERRSVMKWRSEILHHERRFERALRTQLVERSPDDVPPTARQLRVRALPWALDVSRAHALLALNDAAQVSVFMYRYILRESCSQFDSLPLTSLCSTPRSTAPISAMCSTATSTRGSSSPAPALRSSTQ